MDLSISFKAFVMSRDQQQNKIPHKFIRQRSMYFG